MWDYLLLPYCCLGADRILSRGCPEHIHTELMFQFLSADMLPNQDCLRGCDIASTPAISRLGLNSRQAVAGAATLTTDTLTSRPLLILTLEILTLERTAAATSCDAIPVLSKMTSSSDELALQRILLR